jgi:hypothetical protein
LSRSGTAARRFPICGQLSWSRGRLGRRAGDRAVAARGRGDGRGAHRVPRARQLFAWAARERDGGGLGIRVDREEKQLILDSDPDVYFSSPHYDGWPGVQVRLEAIGRDQLRMRLEDAWLIQAPRKLAAAYVADDDARR